MRALFLFFALSTTVAYGADYPLAPDPKLTPGSLCQSPHLRYFERIPYCKRDVSSRLKKQVFQSYRNQLGYKLDPSRRMDYKIDHYIPLCAGGSNNRSNLWPQHKSLYRLSDPLEHTGCEKLAQGKIKQKMLIDLLKEGKAQATQAKDLLLKLKRL